ALLGTQQVRPVIGAVEPDSLAASAGLRAGQEIVAVDGEATPGWSAVNLQLARRLGESGTVEVQVREEDASLVGSGRLVLRGWLGGVDEPEPLASLGIRPWRPAAEPVVSELDPQGPAQAAGVRLGDRLLALGELQIDDWQQVVDWLREHPAEQVTLRIARAGEQLELPLTLGAKGEGEARVGYLGVGVKGGEWPARMLHEVSFGPLDGVAESLRRTWNMT